MVEKNTNIYDLVNEVNKNSKKSSIAAEKEINDIYSMLDDIKQENNISVEDVREKVNSFSSSSSKVKFNDNLANYSTLVKKPEVPDSVNNYETYSECVIAFISAVNYGENNSREYVKGHTNALEKYYLEIESNHKDIYLVEARINEEINNFSSKSSLRDKGYYDGLLYVLKSIKKAKELLSNKVNNILIQKLT